MEDILTEAEERGKVERFLAARRAKIAAVCDEEFLGYLEEHFETNMPTFQRQADGGYDPLDAMRRDAYREVILFLRDELARYYEAKK